MGRDDTGSKWEDVKDLSAEVPKNFFDNAILGMGNPLLDMSGNVDQAYLDSFELKVRFLFLDHWCFSPSPQMMISHFLFLKTKTKGRKRYPRGRQAHANLRKTRQGCQHRLHSRWCHSEQYQGCPVEIEAAVWRRQYLSFLN